MRFHFLGLAPWAGLCAAAVIAACSSNGGPQTMSVGGSGSSSSGSGEGQSGSSTTGSGSNSGSGSGASASGSAGSGSAGSGTATGSGSSSGGASSGAAGSGVASSGGGSGSSSGVASSGTSDAGSTAVGSPGCGKTWANATGTWVEVAGPKTAPGLTVYGKLDYHPNALEDVVSITGPTDPMFPATEERGYWVLIPKGYDPTKPYKVIYEGAGCDDSDAYNAGSDGLPFQSYDGGEAIQVGLDYDTMSIVPQCYNNQDPDSNDFAFMPWLQTEIANDFCVDTGHEFWEGYSSGGWVDQQFNCAFPSAFRGFVSVTGSEPPNQPTCNPAPTAWMHIHDSADPSNSYASILPGCSRVLKQNGCSVTDCSNPEDTTKTTPWTFPTGASWLSNIPGGTKCVQFNGCPADYPVVFCTTTGQAHNDQRAWSVPAFWDFITRLN